MARTTVVLSLLLLVSTAVAAPKTAREFYQSATSHYNLSEWQAALDDFREAYRLKPDSAFLFNIAQCHRQLGQYREAANFYRAFRREGGGSRVDRLITEMDAAAAAQHDREIAAEREKAERDKAEREKAEREKAATQPASTSVSSATGTGADLTVAAAPRERPLLKRPWFWAAVAGGAAVLAAGVTVAVVFGTPAKNPALTFGSVAGN
jgi:tetratricopeptide (TPR) repeat protein